MTQSKSASITPFIVIDGQDGSGKGTQITLLRERLEKNGFKVIFTREPGGVPFSEKIREILLTTHLGLKTEFLLFWASRAEWFEQLVKPILIEHIPVFSDRGVSSTYAYQVCAREAPWLEEEFWRLKELVLGNFQPTAYIIIDVPAEISFARTQVSNEHSSVFDKERIEFYEKVRSGFKLFSEKVGTPTFLIDGARSREEVHEEIYRIVCEECGW